MSKWQIMVPWACSVLCYLILEKSLSGFDREGDPLKDPHLLQCMGWVNQAFEQITKDTIKHCFEKCWFSEVSLLAEEPDEEFEDLLNCLTIDVMPDEYASFDDDVDTSEMPINVQKKDWKDILCKHCIENVNADPDEID